MGNPIWQLPNGGTDLGTISENIYFSYELNAIDTDGGPITYSAISGDMPAGLTLLNNTISGVPIDVSVDTKSKFSIRATSTTGNVSDYTFTVTVSGQQAPKIVTHGGQLGQYYYGSYVDLTITAVDSDEHDTLTWSVITGELPNELTLTVNPDNDRIAYIRGYAYPVSALPDGTEFGFDVGPFDFFDVAYGFDYGLRTVSKNYPFTIAVSDGISEDSENFSIFLLSKDQMTADSDTITADAMQPTVDISTKRNPIILNTDTDWGTIRHDNYFAFQVVGKDFDQDIIYYKEVNHGAISRMPLSLEIDQYTGWIYGYLDKMEAIEKHYSFDIVAYKANDPNITSEPKTFTVTVEGDISNVLTWLTPDVMHIENGAISDLAIQTTNTLGLPVTYRIQSGSLPTGMILTPHGSIIGRPNFGFFSLDNGTTYFDNNTTTFDNTYTFVVSVQDTTSRSISASKEFKLIVDPVNEEPYEALYLVAKPSIEQKDYLTSFLRNTDIVPEELIYKIDDPYFSITKDLRVLVADGLKASPIEDYADAINYNHYTRHFRYEDIKIATAYNEDRTPRYDVLYVELNDQLETDKGSIAKTISSYGLDVEDITERDAIPDIENGRVVIRPASLTNMRNAVIDHITQSNKNTLPAWMTDAQEDGRRIGFIFATVLVYLKPGAGKQVLFNLKESGFDITKISFDVDRYVWDNNMTVNHDVEIPTGNRFHYSECALEEGCDGYQETTGADYVNVVGFAVDPFSEGVGFEGPDDNDTFLKFPKTDMFK